MAKTKKKKIEKVDINDDEIQDDLIEQPIEKSENHVVENIALVCDKDYYLNFITNNHNFEFYSKRILLFDTNLSKDISIFKFYDEYFTVFDKPYSYQGIKIKIKK